MNDVIGSVRQVIQDFLAPELRQHRAELVSIRGELSAKIEAVESLWQQDRGAQVRGALWVQCP